MRIAMNPHAAREPSRDRPLSKPNSSETTRIRPDPLPLIQARFTRKRLALALLAGALLSSDTPLSADAEASEIVAWGDDQLGQITNLPTGSGYTAITATFLHAYALAADGSIAAWGNDGAGQVSNTPTGTGFTAIAAGDANGYALAADGSIAAWGSDGAGQTSSAPAGTGFTAIAGGAAFGCALAADGSIAAWGADSSGTVSGAPAGTGFTAIAAGSFHGYALAADGSIAAWGSDSSGQVSNTPAGAGHIAIASGDLFGLALRTDGSIAVWGAISAPPAGTGYTAIAGCDGLAFAVDASGALIAWGNNDLYGQISNTPTGPGFVGVAAGSRNGYALQNPTFDLSWSAIDNGGGTSAAGNVALSGVIGQPDTQYSEAGPFELRGGFYGAVCNGTTSKYGVGCPGTSGFTPEYDISGCAEAGRKITHSITNAMPGTQAFLFLGVAPAALPMGGGCTLNTAPLLPAIIGPFPIFGPGPGQGEFHWNVTLPPQAASFTIYEQIFLTDPNGAIGFSNTNGVELSIG